MFSNCSSGEYLVVLNCTLSVYSLAFKTFFGLVVSPVTLLMPRSSWRNTKPLVVENSISATFKSD